MKFSSAVPIIAAAISAVTAQDEIPPYYADVTEFVAGCYKGGWCRYTFTAYDANHTYGVNCRADFNSPSGKLQSTFDTTCTGIGFQNKDTYFSIGVENTDSFEMTLTLEGMHGSSERYLDEVSDHKFGNMEFVQLEGRQFFVGKRNFTIENPL